MKKGLIVLLGVLLLSNLVLHANAKLTRPQPSIRIIYDRRGKPVGGTILPFNPVRLIGTILILTMIVVVIFTVGAKGLRSSLIAPKTMRY